MDVACGTLLRCGTSEKGKSLILNCSYTYLSIVVPEIQAVTCTAEN